MRMREYLIFANVVVGKLKDKATITGREIHLKQMSDGKNNVSGGVEGVNTAHITYCSIDMDK